MQRFAMFATTLAADKEIIHEMLGPWLLVQTA
jgi:hypothetical protein